MRGSLLALLILPLSIGSAFAEQATSSDELEQVLQGFDEPASGRNAKLDSVLEGFDDSGSEQSSGDPSLDAVLGGFDSDGSTESSNTPLIERSPGQLSGAVTLSGSYNYAHSAPAAGQTDYRGLSRLRAKLNLQYDYDFGNRWRSRIGSYTFYDLSYQSNGRDQYTQELLDDMESEVELGELFLQGPLASSLDLKLGRQIVVWGKSDSIRVTDILNPLDNREPGMVDIEDLRLPVAMAKLDYYVGDWGISAMAIPEIRFNKNPSFGSDFYPMPTHAPNEVIPDSTFENSEYALALNGIFSGWDLSFYAADVYDDTSHIEIVNGQPSQQHARLTMLGSAINIALGSWLLKAEAAYLDELIYTGLPKETFQRSDWLLGADYSGLSDTILSIELANRHLLDYNPQLAASGTEEDNWQTALRYTGDFMHQQLQITALASFFGKEGSDGGFSRLSAKYTLQDALALTGGVVTYQSGKQFPFAKLADNDRLFVDLKQSF